MIIDITKIEFVSHHTGFTATIDTETGMKKKVDNIGRSVLYARTK